MTAAAWAAPYAAIAICAAWAARDRISTAILHARWARHCRRHPALPGHETIREPERS